MPKFSVAFIAPVHLGQLKHRVLDSQDTESALRTFFTEEATSFYSEDEKGYFYFKDDFFDESSPAGSIVQCD